MCIRDSFEDISQEKDYEHLCNGIAETLLNALGKISDLRIPARTSSFSFKDKGLTVQEIGQKLNVQNVLEGSVQVSGDEIRITAQLSKVEDGFQIWSEDYEQKMENVFSIQDDIALKIIKSLSIKLIGEKEGQIIKHYTDNIEAYDLYNKGRHFVNMRTEESLKRAIEYFDQAIERESDYAAAYSGKANAYGMLPYYEMVPSKEALSKAREAATKAIELDGNLPEAHTALGHIQSNEWNWKEGEREYNISIELNPNNADVHYLYAMLLLTLGRFDKAVREIELARELDPFSPIINRNIGQVYYYARQYDKAITTLKNSIEMAPNFSGAHAFLGLTYLDKEMYEEALAEFQTEKEISGAAGIGMEPFIIITYARMGDRKEAEIALKKFQDKIKDTYFSPAILSVMYIHLDDLDKASQLLEEAYEARDNWLSYIKVTPLNDPIRDDPRFKAVLKKMNLE